ncbi:hypothetical protein M9H77_35698 [Catharanthus roseus]|uniref:Uncharacterized protein n=1 Tax=Catharanthus roseus TaxID=4058 RepID=A0ACB9ZQH6_CATRO|nr:hypothetical protein M9H77_35698 [Catharanthus roseus]
MITIELGIMIKLRTLGSTQSKILPSVVGCLPLIILFQNLPQTAVIGPTDFLEAFHLLGHLSSYECLHNSSLDLLSGLLVEFYDRRILEKVGDTIGKFLQDNTYVQVDINSHLIPSARIGDLYVQQIQYEGIDICFSCGYLGRAKKYCPPQVPKVNPSEGKKQILCMKIPKKTRMNLDPATLFRQGK